MSKNFEAPFGQTETDEMKRLRNEMQIDLMKRQLGDTSSSQDQIAWVEKNSTDFSNILDVHPEILEEYRNGDPETAFARMEEKLGSLHEARYKKAA